MMELALGLLAFVAVMAYRIGTQLERIERKLSEGQETLQDQVFERLQATEASIEDRLYKLEKHLGMHRPPFEERGF